MNRAGIILVILILLFVSGVSSTVYAGIKTGELEKILVTPVKDFFKELSATPVPTPTPPPLSSLDPHPTLPATPTPSKKPTIKTVTIQPTSCIQKNIREGEFASNKCYSEADYDDLNYYLNRYNSAVFDRDSADGGMKITCNCRVEQECQFFKQACEDDKNQKSTAESDMNKYRDIINGIIAKGK